MSADNGASDLIVLGENVALGRSSGCSLGRLAHSPCTSDRMSLTDAFASPNSIEVLGS
jgi:hypothetical protein